MAKVWLGVLKWVLILGAITGAILWMRSIKARRLAMYSALPPSIEVVRLRVQRTLDTGAKSIPAKPVPTTLAALRSTPRPQELDSERPRFSGRRIPPFETQIWRVDAMVQTIVERPDHDLYLVIESDGVRGVAELPDPDMCKGSPYYDRIAALRKRLVDETHPGSAPTDVRRQATLTGIGFFGTGSGDDSGARILPLLDVVWQ